MKIEIDDINLISQVKGEVEIKLRYHIEEITRKQLNLLFANYQEQSNIKEMTDYSFSVLHIGGRENIGFLFNKVTSLITEFSLSEELDKIAQDYIKANFETQLKKALDTAMEHRAKTIAYREAAKINN